MLQRCALSKFEMGQMIKTSVLRVRVIECPSTPEQSVFLAIHSNLMEVHRMLATYTVRVRNNHLEIRIAGFTWEYARSLAEKTFKARTPRRLKKDLR